MPMSAPNSVPKKVKHCVFCDIVEHKRQVNDIVLQTPEVIVFHDASPAAKHHLLSCPVNHIRDCKQLTKRDIDLIRQLERSGLDALLGLGANVQDVRLGFHWPPYNSIFHLHLHVLSPGNCVRCSKFRLGGRAFKTVDEVIKHLEKLPDVPEATPSAKS